MISNDLGGTGLRTSCVGLGCAKFGSVLADRPRAHWLALAREAFALGIRHFDTADIYGQGDSERLLGEALRGQRSEVLIASKGGQQFSGEQSLAARLKRPIAVLARHVPAVRRAIAARRSQALAVNFDPSYLAQALAASLSRLQTDYLDIYYLHSPPLAVIAAGDVSAALDSWRQAGKIRAWGISCDSLDQAAAAVAHPSVRLVQFAFDSTSRARVILEAAAARGVAIVARDGAARDTAGGAAAGERAGRLAELSRNRHIASVLVGTTQISHLRENVQAVVQPALS